MIIEKIVVFWLTVTFQQRTSFGIVDNVESMSTSPLASQISDADIGSQTSAIKSVTLRDMVMKHQVIFDLGLIVASSSHFIKIIILHGSHEA